MAKHRTRKMRGGKKGCLSDTAQINYIEQKRDRYDRLLQKYTDMHKGMFQQSRKIKNANYEKKTRDFKLVLNMFQTDFFFLEETIKELNQACETAGFSLTSEEGKKIVKNINNIFDSLDSERQKCDKVFKGEPVEDAPEESLEKEMEREFGKVNLKEAAGEAAAAPAAPAAKESFLEKMSKIKLAPPAPHIQAYKNNQSKKEVKSVVANASKGNASNIPPVSFELANNKRSMPKVVPWNFKNLNSPHRQGTMKKRANRN
jgi:hypothetical protein